MRQKKTRKPTFNDLGMHREQLTIVELLWANHRSNFGRSTVICTCPFCKSDQIAYLWSLSGSGKRCETCGAMLCRTQAFQFTDQINVRPEPVVEQPVALSLVEVKPLIQTTYRSRWASQG